MQGEATTNRVGDDEGEDVIESKNKILIRFNDNILLVFLYFSG